MKNNSSLLRSQILAHVYFTEAKAVQEWMYLAQRKMVSSPLLEVSRCLLHHFLQRCREGNSMWHSS